MRELANLVLVRGVERRGELATRLSLGATRTHLLRHLMVEHAMVGVLAATVAVVAAAATMPLLAHLSLPEVLGLGLRVQPVLDWRVDVMRGAPSDAGRSRWLHARSVLTVVQVTASVVLLVFAGSSIATFRVARHGRRHVSTGRGSGTCQSGHARR